MRLAPSSSLAQGEPSAREPSPTGAARTSCRDWLASVAPWSSPYTAEMLPTDEACRLGLFNRVVDEAAVVQEPLTLAAHIAAKPRMAVALAKQSLRAACASSLAECLERERVNQLRLFKSPDAIDEMRAFLSTRRSG
jgi:enoyl-CoA hydratase/carnithine racemase